MQRAQRHMHQQRQPLQQARSPAGFPSPQHPAAMRNRAPVYRVQAWVWQPPVAAAVGPVHLRCQPHLLCLPCGQPLPLPATVVQKDAMQLNVVIPLLHIALHSMGSDR